MSGLAAVCFVPLNTNVSISIKKIVWNLRSEGKKKKSGSPVVVVCAAKCV